MRHDDSGLTLMELLIALAIAAIIVAVAIPNYQGSVRKARRADAKVALNDLAQRLERCLTRFGAYDSAACGIQGPMDSPEGYYRIVAERTATTYTLTATPQGSQAADSKCTSLILDHQGHRTASGSDSTQCW